MENENGDDIIRTGQRSLGGDGNDEVYGSWIAHGGDGDDVCWTLSANTSDTCETLHVLPETE